MLRKTLMTVACLALLAGGTILRAQESSDGAATDFSAIAAWSDSGQPDAADAPEGVTFSYATVLVMQLQPRVSSTGYGYDFNGCLHISAGTDNRLTFPLLIPDGSEVKFLRIYYNDTNAGIDLTAWLTQYTPGQTSTDLTSVTSTGSGGYGTALSPELTEIFDSSLNYSVIVATNTTDTTAQICGVRVAYYAPLIFRDNFYLARTDGKDFPLCERANGSGCLNMFIARWDYTNKRAYLYFKLPFLGANEDRTLYAFWGNKFDSGMSDLSSLSDCFIFYDDFNTLDTSKWIASSVSGTAYTISNSQISIATGHYITPGDSNPPFVDTISGGTASADSTANPASNACDNNLSTYWRTVFPVSYPHWWKYDFGAGITKTIQSVSIRQDIASNGVRIAIFQGSNDNTNWDNLTSRQLPNNNLKFIFSFPNSTAYRYYRLYCVVGWGYSSDTAGIIEIEFSESYVPEDSSNLVLNGKTSWIIEEGFVGKTGVTSTSYYAHRHLFLTGTTGYNPFDFRYYWNGSINRSHSVVNGSTLVTYTGTGVQGMEQNVFNYNILAYWEDTDYVYQGMKFRNTLPDYFEGWERSVLGNTELTSFRIYDDENGAAQGVLLDWFILRDYDLHLEPLYDVSNLYVPFEDVPVPPLDFTVYGYDVTSTDFHHETTFSGANAVLISDNIADSAPNTFIGNALSGNIVIDFGRYNDDLTSDQLIHFDNNHVTYYNASKLSNNDLNAYGRNYWLCTVSSGVWAAIDFDTPEIVSTLVVQAVSTKLSGMIKNYNFYGSDRDPRYYTSSRVKLAYGVFLSVPYEQTIHFNNSNPYRYYILEAVDTYGGVVALQEWQMFRSSTESRPMVVGQLRLHPLVAESSDYYFPKYIKLLASNDKYNWTTLTKSSLDYIPDEVIDATDIAYNKPTYASSYYYHITENYTSGRAVDGNDNTMWSSNEGTPPHWWSVDLLSTYNIRKIEVLARPGYSNLQSYEFYISTDNVNWQYFILYHKFHIQLR